MQSGPSGGRQSCKLRSSCLSFGRQNGDLRCKRRPRAETLTANRSENCQNALRCQAMKSAPLAASFVVTVSAVMGCQTRNTTPANPPSQNAPPPAEDPPTPEPIADPADSASSNIERRADNTCWLAYDAFGLPRRCNLQSTPSDTGRLRDRQAHQPNHPSPSTPLREHGLAQGPAGRRSCSKSGQHLLGTAHALSTKRQVSQTH